MIRTLSFVWGYKYVFLFAGFVGFLHVVCGRGVGVYVDFVWCFDGLWYSRLGWVGLLTVYALVLCGLDDSDLVMRCFAGMRF